MKYQKLQFEERFCQNKVFSHRSAALPALHTHRAHPRPHPHSTVRWLPGSPHAAARPPHQLMARLSPGAPAPIHALSGAARPPGMPPLRLLASPTTPPPPTLPPSMHSSPRSPARGSSMRFVSCARPCSELRCYPTRAHSTSLSPCSDTRRMSSTHRGFSRSWRRKGSSPTWSTPFFQATAARGGCRTHCAYLM
jgi:hypothetical protein